MPAKKKKVHDLTVCDVSRIMNGLRKSEGCAAVELAIDDYYGLNPHCNDCLQAFYAGGGGSTPVRAVNGVVTGLEPLAFEAPTIPTAIKSMLPDIATTFNPPVSKNPLVQIRSVQLGIVQAKSLARTTLDAVDAALKYKAVKMIFRFPVVRAMVTGLILGAVSALMTTALVSPAVDRGERCVRDRQEKCRRRNRSCDYGG